MILYHGSNIKVNEIDLAKCRPYKDFGQGFYLTDIQEQAQQMAQRVVKLYGGTPWVSAFTFDEVALTQGDIKSLAFDRPSKDWAMFVLHNRDRNFKDIRDALCNRDNKYDIVIGLVANDDIAYLFRTFAGGLIDLDALVRGLEYKSLATQYSFHTAKALKYLQPVEG
jgi:hypothetical protein